MEARSKLIELAAFLDRVDRSEGHDDYRLLALRRALEELSGVEPERTKRILMQLSDPTTAPAETSDLKTASGAWKGD